MSFSTQWDSLQLTSLELPYDRITNELEERPYRLVAGENVYVTVGGKLAKRPGTLEISGSSNSNRIVRLWVLESLETPPVIYLLASVYVAATANYRMEYINLDGASTWTSLGSLRDVNASVYPHELAISRGKAYIKAFPNAAGDKLGSVIFDPNNGTPVTRTWGVLPPTAPAAVVGNITRLSAAIDDVTTSINVVADTGFPVPNFVIQVDFEQMEVTAGTPGTAWTVTRGVNDTTPEAHGADTPVLFRDWSSSDHAVDVFLFWRYAYCFKTSSEHYSSRSGLETNPDKLPSQTGPFIDLVPAMTLTGTADTTNVPNLVVFRTDDGGDSFYELETIANPGATTVTYLDDSLESGAGGGTFNDPVPDSVLTDGLRAPSEHGNNPPPTVTGSKVVGTDAVTRSTPIESYAGRLWFAIDNILFYSGQEEILLGIPEESWDYSSASGRFFRFPSQVTNLKSTNDALYIFTISGTTYQLTGTNNQTFNYRPLFDNIGAPYGQPAAITRFGSVIALLTHDYRVVLIDGDQYKTISDPLFTDLIDKVNENARFELLYFGDLEKEWLVVAAHNDADPRLSRQWIYDLKLSRKLNLDFWSPPWTVLSTAMASSRMFQSQSQRRLVFFVWDPSQTGGRLVRMDPTGRTGSDIDPLTGDTSAFTFDMKTGLMRVPPGDHVNALRVPGAVPATYSIMIDRIQFTGQGQQPDRDPLAYYFWDDLWTEPIQTKPSERPARRKESIGYATMTWPVYDTGQRIAVQIRKPLSKDLMQLCNLAITFAPNSGT